jgi:aryl-alcohol dehydrogenase-like predicted oxidoreductase
LGNSGIQTSAVGFGAWAIGGWMWGGADENDAVAAIHASLDRGVTLIDTAPMYGYGRSEQIVGRAIRGRRDKVVLATKCGLIWDREEGVFHFHADAKGASPRPAEYKVFKCLKPASIAEEIERSLKNLGTDCIDLYQTHWQDPSTPIADSLAALVKLKEQGKIRAIGISNANLDQLKEWGPIDADQEKYSMIDRGLEQNGMAAYCRGNRVAVLAYSPLANGLLTGRIAPERKFNEGDLRRMNPRFGRKSLEKIAALLAEFQPIAARHNATIPQVVIAWTVAQPGITVALCGARNAAQAEENAAGGDIPLSADEIEAIGQAIQRHAAI